MSITLSLSQKHSYEYPFTEYPFTGTEVTEIESDMGYLDL